MAEQQDSNGHSFTDADRRALLIEIMQQMYPQIQAYNNDELLFNPPLVEDPPPAAPPETEKINGTYQIDTSLVTESERLKLTGLRSLEPAVASPANLAKDGLINTTFEFFIADDDPEPEPAGEIEDGAFISTIDVRTNDLHDTFLQNLENRTFKSPVFYIDNGVVRRVNDFKTLEVMLVERGLTYEDIRFASAADYERYPRLISTLNTNESMPNISGRWGYQIRFDSGYLPVAPFLRDPADYYDINASNEFGTPYNEMVYQTQTFKEKLREKYEGNLVTYNIGKDNLEIDGAGNPNPNFGRATSTNVGDIRLMVYGYWKFLDDTRVLGLYNEVNQLGLDIPGTREPAILELYNAGYVTNFEGTYTSPENDQLNTGGVTTTKGNIIGWNTFPHIKGANVLDLTEYQQYLDASNNGSPFELEYMQPYEPAGSVKYYSAGTTTQLAQEALESVAELDQQENDQETLDATYEQVKEDLSNLLSRINIELGQSRGGDTLLEQTIAEFDEDMAVLRNDLIRMFHGVDKDGVIDGTRTFKLRQYSTGDIISTDENVFNLILDIDPADRQIIEQQLIVFMTANQYWYSPFSAYSLFGNQTFKNIMNSNHSDNNYHGLYEYLSNDNYLQMAISQRKFGSIYEEGLGWAESELADRGYGKDVGNSGLDNSIVDLKTLMSSEALFNASDTGTLETLQETCTATLQHALDKDRNRYLSQVQDLVDGTGTGEIDEVDIQDADGTTKRVAVSNLADMEAQFNAIVNTATNLPTAGNIVYHTKRAYAISAYMQLGVLTASLNQLGYEITVPSNVKIVVQKYIPEFELVTTPEGNRFFPYKYGFNTTIGYKNIVEEVRLALLNSLQSIADEYEIFDDQGAELPLPYNILTGPVDGLSGLFANLETYTENFVTQFAGNNSPDDN